jgi:hypothetical protein
MRLIQGSALNDQQRQQVLARFVHRWTHENAKQSYGGRCPACEQVAPFPYVCGKALPDGPKVYTRQQWHAYHKPLTSDAQWLADHAFYVNVNGELSEKHSHCELAYMVDHLA